MLVSEVNKLPVVTVAQLKPFFMQFLYDNDNLKKTITSKQRPNWRPMFQPFFVISCRPQKSCETINLELNTANTKYIHFSIVSDISKVATVVDILTNNPENITGQLEHICTVLYLTTSQNKYPHKKKRKRSSELCWPILQILHVVCKILQRKGLILFYTAGKGLRGPLTV